MLVSPICSGEADSARSSGPPPLESGPHTQKLLDELQVRLMGCVIVGRLELPEAIPVVFFDEPSVEEHRAAVVAAPNAIDRAAERQPASGRPTPDR